MLRAQTDRTWQVVLGTLGQTKTPFGKTTFVDFRAAPIERVLERVLLARSVELALLPACLLGPAMERVVLRKSPVADTSPRGGDMSELRSRSHRWEVPHGSQE